MVAGNIFARMANFYTENIGLSGKVFGSEEQVAEHYTTIHYSRFLPEVSQHDIPIPDNQTINERGAYGLNFKEGKK